MPRAGLSATAVTSAAIDLIDEQGPAALTLAAIAERTGVSAPSLYKHVRNLAELRDRVAGHVMAELNERITTAVLGLAGPDALRALLVEYRRYVLGHPHRYAMLPQAPSNDPVLGPAGQRLVELAFAVLRGYGLSGADAVHAARSIRAVAHGFASLESAGAFELAEDLDTSYERLIESLSAGFRSRTV
ncbi:MAG TPA: TetR/AcrR family transcriptional regulator [Pseudonocardiaceae bacterium]